MPVVSVAAVLSTGGITIEFNQSNDNSTGLYLLLLLANLVSIAICWGYVEVFNATLFRNRAKKPIHWVMVLAFGSSLGFLKGLTTGVFSVAFGVEGDVQDAILSRVLNSTLLGLWTVPVLALAGASFARYKLERAALVSERLEAELRAGSSRKFTPYLKSLQDFSVSAQDLIDKKLSVDSQAQNSQVLASAIRDLINTQLRPISHAIWDYARSSSGEFRLKDFAAVALRNNPFPTFFIALGLVVILIPFNLGIAQPFEALLRTLVTLTIALIIYWFLAGLNKKVKIHPVTFFLIGNFAAAGSSSWLTAVTFGDPTAIELAFIASALMIWLTQIAFFGSLVGELMVSRAKIRAELSSLTGQSGLDSAVASASARMQSRDLAQFLHSNIQNKLLSSALRLETSALSPEDIKALVSDIRQTLLSVASREDVNEVSFTAGLLDITARWEGLVTVELSIGIDEGDVSHECRRAIFQVVSEAISNSVRHGFATKLRIEVDIIPNLPNGIEIRITDDGLGPRSGTAGLGTELFNAVADLGWSITPLIEGGSILKIRKTLR